MKRSTLATRISLLSVGIAVVTALIAGALATGLIRNSGAAIARRNLNRLADLTATASVGTGPAAHAKLRLALQELRIRTGVITAAGTVRSGTLLVSTALSATDIAAVLAGRQVHGSRTVNGTSVYIEARPVSAAAGASGSTGIGAGGPGGIATTEGVRGIVLAQRQVDAVAQDEQAIRRLLVALLIAGALAAVLGLLVAWRLARPLRRTAAAANSLAAGNRDVELPVRGPREVAEVSEAVNTLAGALRHSEARQREFLLSVSHDLRTPLTAISGYAESLAGDVVPPEHTAYVGGVLLGEAKRLERLVGDLLDLARLDARDFRIDLAATDLTGVVHGAAAVWASRCAAAGVVFTLAAPDHPMWSLTDAARVRQVLDGLFDNALRVTPAGAPIVLAASSSAGTVVLEVRDGGPGLTDADLGVAFEQGVLYERYRGVRQVGTGLGLAIVRGLVSRLGGNVEAGHAHEGGARFTVRLPAMLPPR